MSDFTMTAKLLGVEIPLTAITTEHKIPERVRVAAKLPKGAKARRTRFATVTEGQDAYFGEAILPDGTVQVIDVAAERSRGYLTLPIPLAKLMAAKSVVLDVSTSDGGKVALSMAREARSGDAEDAEDGVRFRWTTAGTVTDGREGVWSVVATATPSADEETSRVSIGIDRTAGAATLRLK